MQTTHQGALNDLLTAVAGTRRAAALRARLWSPALAESGAGRIGRGELSMALAMLLFEGVLTRVPMARAYVEDLRRAGRRLVLDHGALRTVAAPSGELPSGRLAFERFLEPLGYRLNGVYPLERLSMTGYVYTHRDAPEDLPQYFVSELETERFSPRFQAAVERVIGSSIDPLPAGSLERLAELAAEGSLPQESAARLLPDLLACFDRQHGEARLADYEILREESEEMAWIATEGQAFNHATDRVEDVLAVADAQRRLGRPIKDTVEVSASGRVLQTAFRAAEVERLLLDGEGNYVSRRVPGSFHEFITRRRREDGFLDLGFDAGNAQGIFAMTRSAPPLGSPA
jgi:hypothetical protein